MQSSTNTAHVCFQAAQPAYMKTNSGRVLEMPKPDDGPTSQQELEELSSTYQATVCCVSFVLPFLRFPLIAVLFKLGAPRSRCWRSSSTYQATLCHCIHFLSCTLERTGNIGQAAAAGGAPLPTRPRAAFSFVRFPARAAP